MSRTSREGAPQRSTTQALLRRSRKMWAFVPKYCANEGQSTNDGLFYMASPSSISRTTQSKQTTIHNFVGSSLNSMPWASSDIRQVQADIVSLLRSGHITFIPNDDTVLKILEVSEHNRHCASNERIALNDPQIPEFNPKLSFQEKAFDATSRNRRGHRAYPPVPSYASFQDDSESLDDILRKLQAMSAAEHRFAPPASRGCIYSALSDADIQYSCGPAAEPEVSRWLEALPTSTALAEVAEDNDQVLSYSLEPTAVPKGPTDEDPTNWRSVGRRYFPHIATDLAISGNTELLPPHDTHISPSPSSLEPDRLCQPAMTITSESRSPAPRRPHTTGGRTQEKPSSRVCHVRRSKTVATEAMAQQLRPRRATPPRSDTSSLKRKRATDVPSPHPRSDERPQTKNGDRRVKKARVESRRTRSLPARQSRTAAATAITFQLGHR
ncbi:hypothetical protein CYLTODRAFT_446290 [Cylindrobasidium torrendii FP15055 ss-10]|uniref:Uncharacterized protein n=1 Tax=Cylindrobasidium torrendii FP15055 ss-10 TaxID=1314674 RepID=A0A0D7B1A7_9AGAR|nr:hypothetical protein CYLTODRAFT_446290 [Cylindrobasidium torrendii FP15055 ss-10]